MRVSVNTDWDQTVRILGDGIDLTRPMRNTMDPAMSQSQLIAAKALCEAFGFDLHRAINDKTFW